MWFGWMGLSGGVWGLGFELDVWRFGGFGICFDMFWEFGKDSFGEFGRRIEC